MLKMLMPETKSPRSLDEMLVATSTRDNIAGTDDSKHITSDGDTIPIVGENRSRLQEKSEAGSEHETKSNSSGTDVVVGEYGPIAIPSATAFDVQAEQKELASSPDAIKSPEDQGTSSTEPNKMSPDTDVVAAPTGTTSDTDTTERPEARVESATGQISSGTDILEGECGTITTASSATTDEQAEHAINQDLDESVDIKDSVQNKPDEMSVLTGDSIPDTDSSTASKQIASDADIISKQPEQKTEFKTAPTLSSTDVLIGEYGPIAIPSSAATDVQAEHASHQNLVQNVGQVDAEDSIQKKSDEMSTIKVGTAGTTSSQQTSDADIISKELVEDSIQCDEMTTVTKDSSDTASATLTRQMSASDMISDQDAEDGIQHESDSVHSGTSNVDDSAGSIPSTQITSDTETISKSGEYSSSLQEEPEARKELERLSSSTDSDVVIGEYGPIAIASKLVSSFVIEPKETEKNSEQDKPDDEDINEQRDETGSLDRITRPVAAEKDSTSTVYPTHSCTASENEESSCISGEQVATARDSPTDAQTEKNDTKIVIGEYGPITISRTETVSVEGVEQAEKEIGSEQVNSGAVTFNDKIVTEAQQSSSESMDVDQKEFRVTENTSIVTSGQISNKSLDSRKEEKTEVINKDVGDEISKVDDKSHPAESEEKDTISKSKVDVNPVLSSAGDQVLLSEANSRSDTKTDGEQSDDTDIPKSKDIAVVDSPIQPGPVAEEVHSEYGSIISKRKAGYPDVSLEACREPKPPVDQIVVLKSHPVSTDQKDITGIVDIAEFDCSAAFASGTQDADVPSEFEPSALSLNDPHEGKVVSPGHDSSNIPNICKPVSTPQTTVVEEQGENKSSHVPREDRPVSTEPSTPDIASLEATEDKNTDTDEEPPVAPWIEPKSSIIAKRSIAHLLESLKQGDHTDTQEGLTEAPASGEEEQEPPPPGVSDEPVTDSQPTVTATEESLKGSEEAHAEEQQVAQQGETTNQYSQQQQQQAPVHPQYQWPGQYNHPSQIPFHPLNRWPTPYSQGPYPPPPMHGPPPQQSSWNTDPRMYSGPWQSSAPYSAQYPSQWPPNSTSRPRFSDHFRNRPAPYNGPGRAPMRMRPPFPYPPQKPGTSRYPAASQPYSGNVPPPPGATQQYPGPSQSYPGTSQSYPGTSQSYPGTSQSYPGPSQSYPGTLQSYPGTYPGTSQSYHGATQPYPRTTQSHVGTEQPHTGATQPYPGTTQSHVGAEQPHTGSIQPHPAAPPPHLAGTQPPPPPPPDSMQTSQSTAVEQAQVGQSQQVGTLVTNIPSALSTHSMPVTTKADLQKQDIPVPKSISVLSGNAALKVVAGQKQTEGQPDIPKDADTNAKSTSSAESNVSEAALKSDATSSPNKQFSTVPRPLSPLSQAVAQYLSKEPSELSLVPGGDQPEQEASPSDVLKSQPSQDSPKLTPTSSAPVTSPKQTEHSKKPSKPTKLKLARRGNVLAMAFRQERKLRLSKVKSASVQSAFGNDETDSDKEPVPSGTLPRHEAWKRKRTPTSDLPPKSVDKDIESCPKSDPKGTEGNESVRERDIQMKSSICKAPAPSEEGVERITKTSNVPCSSSDPTSAKKAKSGATKKVSLPETVSSLSAIQSSSLDHRPVAKRRVEVIPVAEDNSASHQPPERRGTTKRVVEVVKTSEDCTAPPTTVALAHTHSFHSSTTPPQAKKARSESGGKLEQSPQHLFYVHKSETAEDTKESIKVNHY